MIPPEFEIAQYSSAILLILSAVVLVVTLLSLSKLIRPNHPTTEKEMTYECGETPVGSGWLRFNLRFYVVALVFVLFDVELALVFPVATVFRQIADGGAGFRHTFIFFLQFMFFFDVLGLGLLYIVKKGDLGWVRSFRMPTEKGIRSWEQVAPANLEPVAEKQAS
ncbi:MAG: NADH-quinone oxidoreductase subunit A [Planctomycetes bacterium]|nr:NADH-quinone oxidoreductase subunit A [Planctomycetota bacterium]